MASIYIDFYITYQYALEKLLGMYAESEEICGGYGIVRR